MKFTVCCTGCGCPVKTSEEDSEEGYATCRKCGARTEYHRESDAAVIRLKSYASMFFPDEKRRYIITCPECGRRLARSADGTDTTTRCTKCGAIIRHEITDNMAYIKIEEYSGKKPAVSRH